MKTFVLLVFDDISGFMIRCYVLADEADEDMINKY